MECIAKKNKFVSNTNEVLEIMVYGYCEKYYPLASRKNIEYIINEISSKFYDHKQPNVILISHSNLFCKYSLPVESWIKCDFIEDYKKHCLDMCKKLSKNEVIISLPFNSIWKTPQKLTDINSEFMSILSENYLKVEEKTKHISQLTEIESTILYQNLSNNINETYITLSNEFSAIKLNINSKSKIFVIPSIMEVIGPLNKNIYTHEERFRQTLEQVKSIKEKIENSVIILCELSFMSLREIYKISKYTSALIFFNKDCTAIKYANDANKNKAEVYLQHFILSCLGGNAFSHFCKFGGRYSLTRSFNENKFFSAEPSFKIIPKAHDGEPIVESILYSFPFSHREILSDVLITMQEILNKHFTDVEHLLYGLLFNKYKLQINKLETLGIAGHFAGSGAYNSS
jgi:hypothetical protein